MGSFYFKQFTVRQTKSAMKVNTDGVLLAAWASVDVCEAPQQTVLDIGTGTGVIALIIAQRLSGFPGKNFKIEAIDIDLEATEEAQLNFVNSPWSSHLTGCNISLQDFLANFRSKSSHQKYSLIISNPPFFSDSLKAPSKRRSEARHNNVLPFTLLAESASVMLDDEGVFALVLPSDQVSKFTDVAKEVSLYPSRVCRVKTLAGKTDKRSLIEFTKKEKSPFTEETLIMQLQGGVCYTPEYCRLVGDYYTKEFPQSDSL